MSKRYCIARTNAAGGAGVPLRALPAGCSYPPEQILDDDFYTGTIDES